jgi:amino acid transporter
MTSVDAAPARLSRAIGAVQYFTIGFGCIVGVAWVIVLGDILSAAGPAGAAIAMAAGTGVILLVAFCYAEVASARPGAGGEMVYAYELAGSGACFATGWLLALIYVSACAFEAISCGAVADLLFPGVSGPKFYGLLGYDVRLGSVFIGLAAALALWAINRAGAHLTARTQQWVTFARIALMLVFLAFALAWARPRNLTPLFAQPARSARVSAILGVLATVPFWFGGFTVFATAAEESASALHRVGRAVVISVLAAGAFYVALILAIGALAPWRSLVGLKLPAAQAFEVGAGAPMMTKLVLAVALLGNLTAWNALLLAGSRVLFALGRARLGTSALGALHARYHTPTTALGLITAISIAALFVGRGFVTPIVNVSSIGYCLLYGVTAFTLIRLRRTNSGAAAYRAPGGVVTAGFAIVASAAMLAVALIQPMLNGGRAPAEWWVLAGWAVAGLVVWRLSAGGRASLSEAERGALLRGG